MKNQTNDKRSLVLYLVIVFVLTYAIEIPVCLFAIQYFRLAAAAVMFIPAISAAIACRGLTAERSGITWKPKLPQSIGWIALAWLLPSVVTAVGGILYYAVFPDVFSPELAGFRDLLVQQGAEITDGSFQGMSLELLMTIQIVQALTIAPVLNIIPSLGEEIGWRGFLTPTLSRLIGKRPALIVSGIIWGLWHAPLIVLAGYEYGTDYFGAPWLGVMLFCYITTLLGIIMSFLYDRSNSILTPALFHGAFNAIAALPIYFAVSDRVNMLIGPTPNGVLSAVPLVIAAVICFVNSGEKKPDPTDQTTE